MYDEEATIRAGIVDQSPTSAYNSLLLAPWAIERRSLCLHDSQNLTLAATAADVAGAVVNAMMILIAAGLIQRVAIRSIRKRRTFVQHGRLQHFQRRKSQSFPV